MSKYNNNEQDLFGTNAVNLFKHTAKLGSVWSSHISDNKTDLIWLAIVAHNLLQGAMVSVLQGSAKIGALTDRSRSERLEWLMKHRGKDHISEPCPPGRLAGFPILLKRLQNSDCLCPAIQLSSKQSNYLIDLNTIRNNFIHYKGSHWLLHTNDFKLPITAALKTIRTIFQHHESLIWKADNDFEIADGYLADMEQKLDSLR